MLQQVVNLIQNNRLVEARTLCEQLNRSNKKNLDIWLLLADIYQRSGIPDKAENCYRKIIKLKASHAPAHTRLAMLYHGQAKFPKAEASYKRSLKIDNNQASVHFNLAAVLQELLKLDDAVKQYQQAIKLKPDYAKAYANLGFIFRRQQQTEEAIKSYQMALQFAPDMAEIHYNLGLALLETNQIEAAEQHQRQALKLKPNYADALAGLGGVQFFSGDIQAATNSYQQALKHQPNDPEILCGYANALSALGQHELAMQQVKQALDITPENLDNCITKGSIHMSLGQLDEAINCCNKVLKINSQHYKATCLAASVYEKQDNAEQAYHYLSPLLKEDSPGVEAVISFASISKSLDLVDDAIKLMELLLKNNSVKQTAERRRLLFSLGKAYDSQKQYNHAFKHFHTANKLKQAVFNIKDFQQDIDNQINVFSSGFSTYLATSSISSKRPIFIVGMPRSGTSLVEQILASHTLVSGAGELAEINNLAISMQLKNAINDHYPKCIKQTNSEQLDHMAQIYLDCLSNVNSQARHVTDKMPGNFMHLGLIQLLFPEARIIHCIRNPLDNCLSCYFQDFSRSHPWIYDLQNTGDVYLQYQRLMQHWKSVLDIPILDVHYEDLVADQDNISRQMIEFCDLDWDEACLNFHKNKRFIWTASYQQVREPMYKKSVARWKNYEAHIQPLIDKFEN